MNEKIQKTDTLLQTRILEKLEIGHDNALPLKELCKRLDTRNERKVRLAIEDMRHDGYLILVAPDPPFGYFLCETQNEFDAFHSYIRSRIIDEALILRDLKLAAKKKFQQQYGQLPMFIPDTKHS